MSEATAKKIDDTEDLKDNPEKEPEAGAGDENTASEPEAAAEEEAPKVQPVTFNRFKLQEQCNNYWRVNCKKETRPEDLLDVAYWEHVAQHLAPGDVIEVMPDTMEWKALLHVQDKGHNWASVCQMELYDLGEKKSEKPSPSRYEIDFAGSTDKWRVKLDGKVLKKGLATKAIAERVRDNHISARKR